MGTGSDKDLNYLQRRVEVLERAHSQVRKLAKHNLELVVDLMLAQDLLRRVAIGGADLIGKVEEGTATEADYREYADLITEAFPTYTPG